MDVQCCKEGYRQFILNSIMSYYVLRKAVSIEGVVYHIKLIVNLESNQYKSFHLGTAPWL